MGRVYGRCAPTPTGSPQDPVGASLLAKDRRAGPKPSRTLKLADRSHPAIPRRQALRPLRARSRASSLPQAHLETPWERACSRRTAERAQNHPARRSWLIAVIQLFRGAGFAAASRPLPQVHLKTPWERACSRRTAQRAQNHPARRSWLIAVIQLFREYFEKAGFAAAARPLPQVHLKTPWERACSRRTAERAQNHPARWRWLIAVIQLFRGDKLCGRYAPVREQARSHRLPRGQAEISCITTFGEDRCGSPRLKLFSHEQPRHALLRLRTSSASPLFRTWPLVPVDLPDPCTSSAFH